MISRPIKTKNEYKEILAEVDTSFANPPEKGTSEGDRFELLLLLLSDYESQVINIAPPDPIEAIKFRMEQEGLKQRDLIPFIGSRNKVSEVLNRRRPLTLNMIRALHDGLGIPAASLLQHGKGKDVQYDNLDWPKFPLLEMRKKGWINADENLIKANPEKIARAFIAPVRYAASMMPQFRRTVSVRSARNMNTEALLAWTVRVLKRAMEMEIDEAPEINIDIRTMRNLAQLSLSENGPSLAIDFLSARGVVLVIETHLSGTYLDGATFFYDRTRPVIGLTIRFDRLDNFWFTLMHEVAHIALHRTDEIEGYFDDLEFQHTDAKHERDADILAREALIPEAEWTKSPARTWPSPEAATLLAESLNIHPAIVAGRIRFETNSYKILSNIIGYHEVRKHFPDVKWED